MGSPAAYEDGSRLHGFSRADVDLIRAKLGKDIKRAPTDGEAMLFLTYCWQHKLHPMLDQVTATLRNDYSNGQTVEKLTPQITIGGLVNMAERTGVYAGCDAVEYGPLIDGSVKTKGGDVTYRRPEWAKATVYRMVQGQRVPFSAVVYWDEYVAKDRYGNVTYMWYTKPLTMMGKTANAHALRMAFSITSGVYTDVEMMQAANPVPELIGPDTGAGAAQAAQMLQLEGASDDEGVPSDETDEGAGDDLPSEPVAAPARTPSLAPDERMATPQQIASLRKLCARLGKAEPDPATLTYKHAGELLQLYNKAMAQQYDREREADREPAYN